MNDVFLLTCDKKLTKSQLSPTHASTKRKITDELKHNAGWYEVREGSPVEVQWAKWTTFTVTVYNYHGFRKKYMYMYNSRVLS